MTTQSQALVEILKKTIEYIPFTAFPMLEMEYPYGVASRKSQRSHLCSMVGPQVTRGITNSGLYGDLHKAEQFPRNPC